MNGPTWSDNSAPIIRDLVKVMADYEAKMRAYWNTQNEAAIRRGCAKCGNTLVENEKLVNGAIWVTYQERGWSDPGEPLCQYCYDFLLIEGKVKRLLRETPLVTVQP